MALRSIGCDICLYLDGNKTKSVFCTRQNKTNQPTKRHTKPACFKNQITIGHNYSVSHRKIRKVFFYAFYPLSCTLFLHYLDALLLWAMSGKSILMQFLGCCSHHHFIKLQGRNRRPKLIRWANSGDLTTASWTVSLFWLANASGVILYLQGKWENAIVTCLFSGLPVPILTVRFFYGDFFSLLVLLSINFSQL